RARTLPGVGPHRPARRRSQSAIALVRGRAMIPRAVFEQTLLEFLAPVAQVLEDPAVSEIMINGPGVIFVERRGCIERTDEKFDSREHLMAALRNLAQF